MASRSVALLALLLATLAVSAPTVVRADQRDKALVDKVEVRPSTLFGLARIRALVSATELQGARVPRDGKPALTVKVGGSKVPFVLGLSAQAEVELDIVLVIATTDVFAQDLDAIRDALDAGLLTPLEKLEKPGPSRVQVAIIGYGENTTQQKRLGPIAAARTAMKALEADDATPAVALAAAVSDAVSLASRTRPKQVGAMQRPIVIVVSDGDGISLEDRPALTKIGVDAGKKGVRIHALGFSPTKARKPLLTLGELTKQSGGTFRWVQEMEGWGVALDQLVEQLTGQYVVTLLGPIDEVAGRKLAVSIDHAGDKLEAPDVKLPPVKCAKNVCEANQYCVRGECITRRTRGGGGPLKLILIIAGALVAVIVGGLGARAIVLRRRATPHTARPLPMATAAVVAAAAPPVVAAPPGGPVLIVMSGPEASRQIPLHHGFTLGKAPGSHFSLAHDSTASTNHAQITFDGQTWSLTDLGSTNGTFANGNRVTTVRLYPGITLRLGSTELRFWQQ